MTGEGNMFEDIFNEFKAVKKMLGDSQDIWKYEFGITYYVDLVESNLMSFVDFFQKIKELPAKIKAGMIKRSEK